MDTTLIQKISPYDTKLLRSISVEIGNIRCGRSVYVRIYIAKKIVFTKKNNQELIVWLNIFDNLA